VVPARRRKSALLPVGPGESHTPRPQEDWIAVPVPQIVAEETFARVQARLDTNQQTAARNPRHQHLRRVLVSCGRCRLSCTVRRTQAGYRYDLCRGRTDALRAAQGKRCTARYTPAEQLDELVWADLWALLCDPAQVARALERARGGAWLPQQLQARQTTIRQALDQLDRQQQGQLDAIAEQRLELRAIADGIQAFCQTVRAGLATATFAQRRLLVELLIDRVIVTDGEVEIRYVLPTSPDGPHPPFCQLRKDHLDRPAGPGHPDQPDQGGVGGPVAGGKGQLAVAAAAPDQQPPGHAGGSRSGKLHAGPVVQPAALGAVAGAGPTQCSAGTAAASWAALRFAGPAPTANSSLDLMASTWAIPRPSSHPRQRRVLAIDLIGGHPGRRHPSLQGPLQHHPGQLRLGPELDLLRHPGGLAPRPILGPCLG
jgi:hypothetical protein